MAISKLVHTEVIADELARIADTLLKTALTPNLVKVTVGDISSLPAPILATMVPGIFIKPHPAMSNNFDLMPKPMLQKYYFRLVYVRLMQKNENLVRKAMQDAALIANTYSDKLQLPDITNLPSGTHIIWAIFKSIEYAPPEDDYVVRCHADLTAVAMNMEIEVITRRSV